MLKTPVFDDRSTHADENHREIVIKTGFLCTNAEILTKVRPTWNKNRYQDALFGHQAINFHQRLHKIILKTLVFDGRSAHIDQNRNEIFIEIGFSLTNEEKH